MSNSTIKKVITGAVVVYALVAVFSATPASAESASSTRAMARQAGQATRLVALIAKSDKEISARIDSLNKLNTKVQALKNVSDTEKSAITSEIQTEIANLTASKAKVDADTDLAIARTDASSAINSSRIYALVIPQANIAVSADRIATIAGLINGISTKLQARIATAQAAGKDVSALETAIADIATQTASATSQASSASASVASLVPDKGDKTVAASNKTALTTARAGIKTATASLKTARKDIQTVVDGLKSFHIKASMTASSTVAQ